MEFVIKKSALAYSISFENTDKRWWQNNFMFFNMYIISNNIHDKIRTALSMMSGLTHDTFSTTGTFKPSK